MTEENIVTRTPIRRLCAGLALALVGTLALSACGSSDGGGDGDGDVGVSLIVKTTTNPFFVAMQDGAKKAAKEQGVDLTLAAGKSDGDEATQIQAIENAISQGQKGILITPNGPASSTRSRRPATKACSSSPSTPRPTRPTPWTSPSRPTTSPPAESIGSWTAKKLGGEKATIAMLDLFDDKVVSVDYNRDQGFLEGMGIDTKDAKKNGDEAKTGSYSGGDYEIVCNEATQGAEDGGTSAMETCLSKNDDINVVYTINEPAAYGAYQALKSAGKEKDVTIVSVDGGCAGVGYVEDGVIGATSQQYPLKMASEGVKAIAALAKDGTKPKPTEGLDFFDTGVALVTDEPQDGVESIDTAEAKSICWG